MKRKRLGKGLEALIPQVSPEEEAMRSDSLIVVEVSKVRPNPFQPRMELDPKRLDELKQSIVENGVIQPITIHRVSGGFELIAGERRLRAVQDLGYKKVPAFVMEISSEDQMLELALVENIQREDLNSIELAKAYQQLQKEYGLTQEAVAKKVGKDRATVANFVRLLKLPGVIQESLQKSEISMGHARALMGLSTQGEQIRVWRKMLKHGWSVRNVEEVVRTLTEGSGREKKKVISGSSSRYLEIEDKLRSILGTRIRVIGSDQKGRIVISYFSDEELERILELLLNINE
jgi:ParB family chromosome partitioning protein